MKILITGVNGFIGKALARGLAGDGDDIFGLDGVEGRWGANERLLKKFFLQDITQPFSIEEKFDYVCHLAALNVTHVDKADYARYHHVNAEGTENLIKAVRTDKFVLMSTAKVYRKEGPVIDEDSPLGPAADYEKSKLAAEEICRKYLRRDQLIILRPVNIVGPGQADKAVLPLFFKQALGGEPIHVFVPRDTSVHFLYIDDVVDAFRRILAQGNAAGVFNLVSRDAISLEDLSREIVRITQSSSSVDFSNRENAVNTSFASRYAKKVLGWEPRFSSMDIVHKYYAFLNES